MFTRKNVMPWCLGTSGSVRARQIAQSASWASDVHTFWPVSRQPPSARSALVRSEARSEPASGSLNSWHQVISARCVGPRKRSCCASVPYRAIAGPAQALMAAGLPGGATPRDPPIWGDAIPPDPPGPPVAPWASCAARVRQPGLPPSSWRSASARRRYRWASCSQVKPMPPSTWMQSFALSTASSSASAAAAAAASGCSAGDSSAARAASQARAAARSARQAMVAHRCLTAWNSPIGRPNCLRVRAYSAAVPLHQAATPAASAAYRVAARSRTLSVRRPGRRFSGGMTTSAEPDGGQLAGEVERGELFDGDTGLGLPRAGTTRRRRRHPRRGRAGGRRPTGRGRSRR